MRRRRRPKTEDKKVRAEEAKLISTDFRDVTVIANQQYRERLLRQGVHERQAGQEGQERERTDDNAAINEALGKLKKR